MRKLPELVLALGVDATGKSGFLEKAQMELGYVAIEPTLSPEARTFKLSHLNDPLNHLLIQERLRLFRKINDSTDAQIREKLKTDRVATTGHKLITEISHAVMSRIVTGTDFSVPQIIEDWHANAPLIPDEIIFMHAPIAVIRHRLQARLAGGNMLEKMRGFNSPFFLDQYQEQLGEAADILSQEVNIKSFDTSKISLEEGWPVFVS